MTVKQKTQRAVWLLGIAALVLVWCSKSSPLYAFNDWMDANIFFTMGKSMLHGRVLYRDVFDHKGPVLYLLYGLAACVDNTGFGGVLLLETAAFAAFLWLGLRSAEAICGRALHPAWTALPAAAVAASRAFSHGGSAEELLLPLLAAALFGAVSTLRASRPMPLRRVVLHGFLAGCALWLKYTVLGFYLVWAVLLAVLYLRRGWRGPLRPPAPRRGRCFRPCARATADPDFYSVPSGSASISKRRVSYSSCGTVTPSARSMACERIAFFRHSALRHT